ncbi:MAG: PHP domain-containing protein [Pseudomonadales bacterium]
MPINADLHCHSTASDGDLPPFELIQLAYKSGVDVLALTDHDTVDGYLQLTQQLQPGESGMQLLAATEISALWAGRQVHIVGLGVNCSETGFVEALESQKQARWQRAGAIAQRLERIGCAGATEVLKRTGSRAPNRPDFAQFLIEKGYVDSMKQAFKKYLSDSKLGGVTHQWPEMSIVIEWIRESGGLAILAHPDAYGLTRTKLKRLVSDFVDAGGEAMELAALGQTSQAADMIERVCIEAGLAASTGSDFHSSTQGWRKLGVSRSIPASLQPVWDLPVIQLALGHALRFDG